MESFEAFVENLQDALSHLYDPSHHPSDLLWSVIGTDAERGVHAVQTALIESIEALRPAAGVPANARVRRIYELLSCRYVQNLTQEETAHRLNITPRHLRREQQKAVSALAQCLWERRPGLVSAVQEQGQMSGVGPAYRQSPEWRSQVRQELASLQRSAPGTVTNVEEALLSVSKLERALTSKYDIDLVVENTQTDLYAAIHPSALHQVLITAIGRLVQHMSSGRIVLCAESKEDSIQLTVSGSPRTVDVPPSGNLIREILAPQRGSVDISLQEDSVRFTIHLLPAKEITVLVVDDNRDLVHFYQRYTAGTNYRIVHVAEGQLTFESIKVAEPDIIVLDVMLPDIDGWELLVHLYENPETRSIPVVVCSVIRERELALALGAALYLPKPVRRQEFIRGLDQVLSLAAKRASTESANHATAC
jgi:CheY-like chemotaxis protein